MPDAPSAPSVARALLAQARQTLAAGRADAARRQWEAALQLGQAMIWPMSSCRRSTSLPPSTCGPRTWPRRGSVWTTP